MITFLFLADARIPIPSPFRVAQFKFTFLEFRPDGSKGIGRESGFERAFCRSNRQVVLDSTKLNPIPLRFRGSEWEFVPIPLFGEMPFSVNVNRPIRESKSPHRTAMCLGRFFLGTNVSPRRKKWFLTSSANHRNRAEARPRERASNQRNERQQDAVKIQPDVHG